MLISMATGTLISVEKYLNTSYSPDREYVDGEILERNVGEKEHSKLQMALLMLLAKHGYPKGFKIWPEQRVQVRATRFRIPDVCVTVGEPDEPVFTTPPLICIETIIWISASRTSGSSTRKTARLTPATATAFMKPRTRAWLRAS